MTANSRLSEIIRNAEGELLENWIKVQRSNGSMHGDLLSERDLREQSREFLSGLRDATQAGVPDDITQPEWAGLRDVLSDISRERAKQGFSPSETAMLVFSLKQSLFERLRKELSKQPEVLAEEVWASSVLLDKLGLFTTEVHQKSREEIIQRQQTELMELSTPVVQLWENILALPLIGVLDSARTQVVMENLLQKIVDTGASIAIIDITGVPTVDTLVAQHLMKTVAAARLMGADCIISGIRPAIAQTIVHLGVNLSDIITKATLADAFAIALERTGARIQGAGTSA